MKKFNYLQINNLGDLLEQFINNKAQEEIKNESTLLNAKKKEKETLEKELNEYIELAKDRGTEDTYIYGVKTGNLEEKISDLEEEINDIEDDLEDYTSRNLSNNYYNEFCELLASKTNIPVEQIDIILDKHSTTIGLLKGNVFTHDIEYNKSIANDYIQKLDEKKINAAINCLNLTGSLEANFKDLLSLSTANEEEINKFAHMKYNEDISTICDYYELTDTLEAEKTFDCDFWECDNDQLALLCFSKEDEKTIRETAIHLYNFLNIYEQLNVSPYPTILLINELCLIPNNEKEINNIKKLIIAGEKFADEIAEEYEDSDEISSELMEQIKNELNNVNLEEIENKHKR